VWLAYTIRLDPKVHFAGFGQQASHEKSGWMDNIMPLPGLNGETGRPS
jgi:hypothetical protein